MSQPKVQEIAREILAAFETGTLPKALAQVFLHRDADFPAARWSFRNRLLAALRGHFDARGYRQWQQVGRQVKRGERAFQILTPRFARAEPDPADDASAELALVGFVAVPVFGYLQTEGEPLPGSERDAAFIDQLPLVAVARSWGLEIELFNGAGTPRLGSYLRGRGIALGVENLSVWAHEIVHAADDRLGTLTRLPGQQLDNEVVAELGSAVLLECLGDTTESDRGGVWEYIGAYAKAHKRQPLNVCLELLDRTCRCVDLILATAARLETGLEAEESRAA